MLGNPESAKSFLGRTILSIVAWRAVRKGMKRNKLPTVMAELSVTCFGLVDATSRRYSIGIPSKQFRQNRFEIIIMKFKKYSNVNMSFAEKYAIQFLRSYRYLIYEWMC